MAEVTEVNKSRQVRGDDWKAIAEHIEQEWTRRKRDRRHLERVWKEIDRQLRMEPETEHKKDALGNPDPAKAWMPEMELPLQAQTLEVLTADARRLTLPDSGSWFRPHAFMTDDYLAKVDFTSIIAGDQNDVPSRIDQDNADKLVQGTLEHWHRQYDFGQNLDLINAEAFKYGGGIGRARVVNKRMFIRTARGVVRQEQKIPLLLPVSIKNTYLDDSEHALGNEGISIGAATISEKTMHWADLAMAAKKGSDDPDKDNGGWMKSKLKGLSGDNQGQVKLLEWEGDLIVPRKSSRSLFVPGAIVSVLMAMDGKESATRVVRFRFRKHPFPSYIYFPYHLEHIDTPYASSPLIKGWPVQKAASDSLNRLMMVAALNAQPPVGWNRSDLYFASEGGPLIYPGAQWGTLGDVKPHQIGDPKALSVVYANFLNQYSDVTSVNAPRLGAQTISHTTAFAKEAELARGQMRTVDYVRSSLKGPLTQWLYAAWRLGRPTISKKTLLWIEDYGGAVEIDKDDLPEQVAFEAHGAGGPAEERARMQSMVQSLSFAVQLEKMRIQMGMRPRLDLDAAQDQILRSGGWIDIDVITRGEAPRGVPGQAPQMQGVPSIVSETPGEL